MSLKNWEHELTAFIDGELGEADRLALEQAMAADPALRALENRLRQTVALMARVPAPAPSLAMKRAVLDRLAPVAAPPTPIWFSMPRLLPFAALAAAAGLAAVVLTRTPTPPPAVDEEQVVLAQNLELVEDLDLDGLASPEDLEVVEQLSQLEQTP